MSESQREMCWRLIFKEFGTNIQQIYGVDKILYDTLSRLTYESIHKYKLITMKYQCCANELFAISRVENNKYCLPINILNVKR